MPDPESDPVEDLKNSVSQMPSNALRRAKGAAMAPLNAAKAGGAGAVDRAKSAANAVIDETKGSFKQTKQGISDIGKGHVGKGLKRIAGLKTGGVVPFKSRGSSSDKLARGFAKMHGDKEGPKEDAKPGDKKEDMPMKGKMPMHKKGMK